MAIKITSDSTCDLGKYAEERGVGVFPMAVILDGEVYRDGVTINPPDIFKFVAETNQLPKTSAAGVEEYKEFFEKELEGHDGLIHFNISSKSSVSYNNAVMASKEFDGKVRVIDSYALSTGQGLLVLKACDLRDEGKSMDEIEEVVNSLKHTVNLSFVPDSLDYLQKGGRVSGMVKTVASMFKIHPSIVVKDGTLVPGKKYKGKMTMCIRQYVEDLKAAYSSYDKTRVFVTHSHADQELVDIAKECVKELFDFDEILETKAGSVVTSHCGRNTLGVLFIYND